MGYRIYNMGLPVQVSDKQLVVERKVRPATKQTPNDKTELDDQQMNDWRTAGLFSSKFNQAYQNGRNNNRQSVFQASQIMSSPVLTCREGCSFIKIWQQFEQKRFRHIVVTNKQNKVVGMLSDRDILKHAKTTQLGGNLQALHQKVGQFMIDNVHTATVETPIQQLCDIMFKQHIGALPIVADNGELLGIVTRSDILRTMIKNGPVELWI